MRVLSFYPKKKKKKSEGFILFFYFFSFFIYLICLMKSKGCIERKRQANQKKEKLANGSTDSKRAFLLIHNVYRIHTDKSGFREPSKRISHSSMTSQMGQSIIGLGNPNKRHTINSATPGITQLSRKSIYHQTTDISILKMTQPSLKSCL